MTRGDIFLLDFGIPVGSEPGFLRPVVIIQSEKENLQHLNTVVVVPLTSNLVHKDAGGNAFIPKELSGLSKDSVALVHQIVVVDRVRLNDKLSSVPRSILQKIEGTIDYVLKD